jgi:hypothetical protein
MTLTDLQIAIDAGNDNDIRAFYQACEVESGNDRLFEYGEEFGFKTTVVQEAPASGRRLMVTRDMSRVLYNSTNISSPSQLLRRQGIELYGISGFMYDTQIHLRDTFQLENFDKRTTFATYADFLIVAMHGQTEQARKVRARIMQAEARQRTADKVREATGLSPEDLEAQLLDGKQDAFLAQNAQIARLYVKQRQLEARQDATEKTVEQMRSYSRMTLPDYAALHELDKRFGKKWYKECGIELVNVHRINGKDVLREGIASEVYHHLNRYLVYIMDTFVPRWLMQLYGRGGL